MDRLRFPLLLGFALAVGAMSAHAQSAPVSRTAPAPVAATIEDIEVAQDGETVSILVKLSGQPLAASAQANGKDLKLDIDGVVLAPLSMTPPAGSLVTRVAAEKGEVVLSGAALIDPDVVVYRHAVLVKARLAEPATIGGASLMTGAAVVAKAEPPLPVITALPKYAPAPAVNVPPPLPTASLAGVDVARCAAAEAELATDSWALVAMGDVALCLIDQGKADEARAKLDQLGAITPQDWRVSLGRGVLALQAGDSAAANEQLLAASLGAPGDAARAAITARIVPEGKATPAELEVQLPLP